ncbi:FIST N-terminal domain-containing protein [Leadbettera azotonutricia]|uniref:Uncharacterized protein n=1 Tax=Leadbettera azotonutricia (strain ATCC BAA-888 / DSM 13862 / ZAS-9) TaxID=545695 RepID=F5YFU2_LEAAZ|nr:FIST N-terminal domain-containing protein [Leadbettera azotonutricia]AEF81214.1 hypothetical protein TREAZ_2425 [Leadbettera azotonutricia ZAS-9]
MIRMLNAHTLEIDDPELAFKEIQEQLDVQSLSKNSVGILSCHHEFIDTGIVKKICEAMPFDVIGLTTMVTLVNGTYDMYMLGLTVLTSDDVSFKAIKSSALTLENCEEELTKTYQAGLAGFHDAPSLIFTILPSNLNISGSMMVKHLDKACGGIPVWGTAASDDSMAFTHVKTIFNGIDYDGTLVMILMYGPIKPKFIVTALPDRNISPRKVIITESDGYVVKTVNDMPLRAYFESMGIAVKEGPDATAVPIMLNYGDGGKAVASAFFKFYPDGSGLAGVEVPNNASFSLGEINYAGIIETAEESILQALKEEQVNGMMMFPCVTRYVMTSPHSEDEMRLVIDKIGGKFPYLLAYSGGEVCPVPGSDGKLHNRFHNYTFVACTF